MRLPQWTGYSVALGAMLLIGCSANMLGTSPDRAKTAGKVSLFDNPNGYGSLVMRVVDQRRGYGVQSLADAEQYDEVQIRLGGSKIQPRSATMSANADHRYQSNELGMLPPGSDYNLIVSLASHSVILNSRILVGQGAAENIEIFPGATRSVTVYINAVGGITLYGDRYRVTHSSPEVGDETQGFGFPEVVADTVVSAEASFSQDPAIPASQKITHIRLQLTDGLGNTLFEPGGQELASSSATSSVSVVGSAFRAFHVPVFPGVEKVAWLTIYGMHLDPFTQKETVIGTKTRGLLMLKGATLSADLNPPLL